MLMSYTNPEIVLPVTIWSVQPLPYTPFKSPSMILMPDFGSAVSGAAPESLSIPPPLSVLFETVVPWSKPGNHSALKLESSSVG
jgi:hypothetical protein